MVKVTGLILSAVAEIPAHLRYKTGACQSCSVDAQADASDALLRSLLDNTMSHCFCRPQIIKSLGIAACSCHASPHVQVAVLKMMRLCGRQSAACLGNAWPCALVPRRLSSGYSVSTTCQDKRSSRCVLVVSEAKKLSSLVKDATARQVWLREFWLPRYMLTSGGPAANSVLTCCSSSSVGAAPSEGWMRPALSRNL